MGETRKDVEELKANWESDPCWDLHETEGFEEYREELKAYQEECEAIWEEERKQGEREIDFEADKLGIRGLYRLIKKHEDLLKRHTQAIELLSEGKSHEAWKVLQGHE